MKVINDELRRRLNLVDSSKTFVLKEIGVDGHATVRSVDVVPNDDGVYWVGGATTLANSQSLVSVFRVDTNAGGSLLSIYWKIQDDWFEHDSEETFRALAIKRKDAFPFDWSYRVSLENDIFH